jgi:hypothetical protein
MEAGQNRRRDDSVTVGARTAVWDRAFRVVRRIDWCRPTRTARNGLPPNSWSSSGSECLRGRSDGICHRCHRAGGGGTQAWRTFVRHHARSGRGRPGRRRHGKLTSGCGILPERAARCRSSSWRSTASTILVATRTTTVPCWKSPATERDHSIRDGWRSGRSSVGDSRPGSRIRCEDAAG